MKLIKPSFQIMGNVDGDAILKSIEVAGRTCYKSEDKITSDSAKKFVLGILEKGHESVLEHEKVTVRIICDRGVTHEIVRHRIASYSQESTRYCDYAGGHVTFVIPPWVDVEPCESIVPLTIIGNRSINIWLSAMNNAEHTYQALRKEGWRPEQARSVLPNSLKTEIVCTYNLREWRHFFKLRTADTAHPQMREITIPMLADFKRKIPVIFDDITGGT